MIHSRLRSACFIVFFFLLASCNFPGFRAPDATPALPASVEPTGTLPEEPTTTPIDPVSPSDTPEPTITPAPVLNVPRIRIRTIDDAAEFYNPETGETFTPRGVNYVHFHDTGIGWRDCVLSPDFYDPVEVRSAFHHLAEYGYNTIRLFFDTCSDFPGGVGNWTGPGVNPGYMDNFADLLRIAGEEGIYVIPTANSIVGGGEYWDFFDSIFFADDHFGFEDARNADWLHTAGVETKRKIWSDLLNALVARDAPLEVVLGWSLTNEYWLWGDAAPPFTYTEGLVTTANGQTYDMVDPAQKRQMAVDGALYFIEEIVATIKSIDPEGLTTMGFYSPAYSPERYIVTPELLPVAPLDFWDFHGYYDTPLSPQELAESFGMIGYEEKPIIMGETAAGYEVVPSAVSSLQFGLEWIAASCVFGFDGWLHWGYYPWPDDVGGKAWAFLEDGERIFRGMSPLLQPDPCVVPELEVRNLAAGQTGRASGILPDQPIAHAVDGRATSWGAGGFPPQWLEIDLGGPQTITRVAMNVEQWPPGITRHRVEARLEDGTMVFLGEIEGFTLPIMNLAIDLPAPLSGVTAVRVTTLASPSWVSWREIEVLSGDPGVPGACLGTTNAAVSLLSEPESASRPVADLAAGRVVNLLGWYSAVDGTFWGQIGGGVWAPMDAISLPETCVDVFLEVVPEPALVSVTFEVQVPAGTPGEIFLTANFSGLETEPWVPWMIPLSPVGGDLWRVEMLLPAGSEAAYAYTRGSFETLERPAGTCSTTPERTLVVGEEPMVVMDEVARWRDLDCGG